MRLALIKSILEGVKNFISNSLNPIILKSNNVDTNLRNDDYQNRLYLGTYFPRSLYESANAFYRIFNNSVLSQKFYKKQVINILDLGTGTGGNLIGLMAVLYALLDTKTKVTIYAVDGNKLALDYFLKITNFICKKYNINFEINTIEYIFESKLTFSNDLDKITKKIGIKEFDLVLASKFVSEFYHRNQIINSGFYHEMLNVLESYLNEDGLVYLLDVCAGNFTHSINYNTITMSNEIRNYMKSETAQFRIILPLACSVNAKTCNDNNCYKEFSFEAPITDTIKHTTKIVFYFFAKQKFADEILNSFSNTNQDLIVSYNKYHPSICRCGQRKILNKYTNLDKYECSYKLPIGA